MCVNKSNKGSVCFLSKAGPRNPNRDTHCRTEMYEQPHTQVHTNKHASTCTHTQKHINRKSFCLQFISKYDKVKTFSLLFPLICNLHMDTHSHVYKHKEICECACNGTDNSDTRL